MSIFFIIFFCIKNRNYWHTGQHYSSVDPLVDYAAYHQGTLVTKKRYGLGHFPCPKCSSVFNHKKNLNRHVMYECGQSPRFECPYCGAKSKRASSTYIHVRNRHPNLDIYCIDDHAPLHDNIRYPLSSKNFSETENHNGNNENEDEDKDTANTASKINNNDVYVSDSEDSFEGFNVDELPASLVYMEKMDMIVMPLVAPKRFRIEKKKLDRLLKKKNERPLQCGKCSEKFAAKKHLLNHLKKQCGLLAPKYRCPYCKCKATMTKNIYQHIRMDHPTARIFCIVLATGEEYKL
ncbi:hypothetical protein TKK_0011277 [Trichogramma kaykai]